MNIQCYYDGYDQDEDDDSNNSESESSGDEVEKDVLTFFKSKNIKTSLSKSELADEFEAEMSQQLDSLIDKEKNKYFPDSTDAAIALKASSSQAKQHESSEKMKNEEDINYLIEDTDSEGEMATGERCKKKKPQFTDDDLLYDPNMDDEDEKWMNKHRET